MKPVKGFEDYKVSKDGDVFNKDGNKLTVGRDNQGYATVTLRKDGKAYTKRLHRVVGETYLKPIEGKNIINHKDGDKSHCKLVNLEYMSNSENTQHGYDNGFYKSRSNLPVLVVDKDGKELEFTSVRSLSRDLGVNRKTVSAILNGVKNNNYDYTFKYKEAGEDMYREYIEKLAEEKKKDSKAKTVAKSVAGVSLIGASKDRVLGQKTLYHGTSNDNWKNIKKEGLKASKGGEAGAGMAVGNGRLVREGKNNVHLTGNKRTAKRYAKTGEAGAIAGVDKMKKIRKFYDSDSTGSMEDMANAKLLQRDYDSDFKKAMASRKTKGKVVKVKMGYNKWKNDFKIDTDERGKAVKKVWKGDASTPLAKHMAGKGSVDVGKSEIVGLHKASDRLKGTVKNMPKYIKSNKGRFGTGVAMAGLGTGFIASAMKNADKKRKEK